MSLTARDVTVAFDGRTVLHGVSLTVDPGQTVGLRGPSGVGKTTLARALAGLVPVQDGQVSCDGRARCSSSPPAAPAALG